MSGDDQVTASTSQSRDDETNTVPSDQLKVVPFDRLVLAHRLVQAGLLLGLIWKWRFFKWSAGVYTNIPLEDPFFPEFLRWSLSVAIAYLASVGAIGLNLVTASRFLHRVCAWITFVGATVLCLHQGSYNDMTFVTTWWTALWSLWFVHRIDDKEEEELVLKRAAWLSRAIISMILLGGAVGKWTPEYWSGEVLYDIYFLDRDFWVFNLIRDQFETDSLRLIAKWYSRMVIGTETIAGFTLWLLPPKIAAIAGIVLLSSIALMSNFLLFSVLFSLIGLAAVGLLVAKRV